uniref:FAM13A-like domain-containing protein n=1 Tax=Glossina brevipalpis TaxID=37001 RepID=A0A1A9W0Y3_9MUSC
MRHPNTGLSEDDLSRLTGSSSSSSASCCSKNSASSSPSSSSSSSSSSSPATSGANTPDCNESQQNQTLDLQQKQKSYEKHHHHHQQQHTNIITDQNDQILTEQLHNNKNTETSTNSNITTSTQHQQEQQIRFNSTYLPEIINPLEWQKSRKRKERLDSTSSAIQDRKLQRSNSEELLPPTQDNNNKLLATANTAASAPSDISNNALKTVKNADNIRRVSSEDFKRTPYDVYERELKDDTDSNQTLTADENDGSLANRQMLSWTVGVPIKDMSRRSRYETSPARSQRLSPIRMAYNNGNGNGKYRDSDDSECEHERRRSSERFCKSRVPPGRKASGVTKKTSGANNSIRYLPSKLNDENVYKYDLSTLKYERRGFVSKKANCTEKNSNGNSNSNSNSNTNDHNDNNLIDFGKKTKTLNVHLGGSNEEINNQTNVNQQQQQQQHHQQQKTSSKNSSQNSLHSIPLTTSAQEALPWDRSVPEDQTPVLSRRYATVQLHLDDSIDTAALLSKVKPFPPQMPKQAITAQSLSNAIDEDNRLETLNTFRTLTSLENVRTRELMQVIPSVMSFQSPEERLKQINKRLTALKKKLSQLEEAYENRMGYRPSQADRLNDKYMKNILSELSKLRKERHELKDDPMAALGLKSQNNSQEAQLRLEKMKITLREIEQTLNAKRDTAHRSDLLDDLTPNQLVQEKAAVQHCLLHFESLYGRPSSKEERDVARPLYDRYRQLKRFVSRSVLSTGTAASGAPDLPTILEHEAMVFESTTLQYSSNNSTETTNSPSDSVPPPTAVSSDESSTTNTVSQQQQQQQQKQQQQEVSENISALTIEQLWELLEKTREEKKLLKRTIREYETIFEEQMGRKMLKNDRKTIEDTYVQYKEKKAKTRLLQALIKKQISR